MKNRNQKTNTIHADWLIAQKVAYEPAGLVCSDMIQEVESHEYSAGECRINGLKAKFRVAKITPTKIGRFVTLWKRIGSGPIIPFAIDDPIDLFIISVRCGEHLGQFIFPKNILHEKGYVSGGKVTGKRAMRVYPLWDMPDSVQAKKTQAWQSNYFVCIEPSVHVVRLQGLIDNLQ